MQTQSSTSADWNADTFARKIVKVQGTKKKGCVARMHTKKIEVFPDYKVSALHLHKPRVSLIRLTSSHIHIAHSDTISELF